MKKTLFFILLIFMFCPIVYAQQWDKTTKKTFRKVKSYNLVIDMSKAKFAQLDSADFVIYYSGREGKEKKYFGFVLKNFRDVIKKRLEKSYNRQFLLDAPMIPNSFTVKYEFLSVSEKGGLTGVLYIYPNFDEKQAKVFDFNVEDGRWNNFENLLFESGEKLCRHISFFDQVYFTNFDQAYFTNTYISAYKERKTLSQEKE